MLTFSRECLVLIKQVALSTHIHTDSHRINLPVPLIGYESIIGKDGVIRVETLNPYGYFWCLDYRMPENYLESVVECIASYPSWSGGDRTILERYKERLSFSVNQINQVSLKREILAELDKEVFGKKSFMGVE